MPQFVRRFRGDQSGATAIEYSLIAAFVFLAIIVTTQLIGTELNSIFTDTEAGFKQRPAL